MKGRLGSFYVKVRKKITFMYDLVLGKSKSQGKKLRIKSIEKNKNLKLLKGVGTKKYQEPGLSLSTEVFFFPQTLL